MVLAITAVALSEMSHRKRKTRGMVRNKQKDKEILLFHVDGVTVTDRGAVGSCSKRGIEKSGSRAPSFISHGLRAAETPNGCRPANVDNDETARLCTAGSNRRNGSSGGAGGSFVRR